MDLEVIAMDGIPRGSHRSPFANANKPLMPRRGCGGPRMQVCWHATYAIEGMPLRRWGWRRLCVHPYLTICPPTKPLILPSTTPLLLVPCSLLTSGSDTVAKQICPIYQNIVKTLFESIFVSTPRSKGGASKCDWW